MAMPTVWPAQRIAEFCHRWKVSELSLFGSALGEDFRPDSDIDLLYTFSPGAERSLLDLVNMEEELAQILGRKVDLVSRRAIERSHNWIRRKAILEGARRVYGS
ncbi:MAG: nucleotidyltransferase family protein [Desulfarculus sp.]|nr:nucleotidyltransferase family protein [Desulfarculus sp.]